MIYTNKFGIPQEVADAIINRQHKYDSGEADFSATELIDSPRRVQLKKRHEAEIEVDVTSLLESWKGHLIHDSLEDERTANRLYAKIGASVVSGAYDYYRDGVLKDYKTISVWNVLVGNPFKKWREQLGIYQYLLQYHRMPVHQTQIIVIFKDWSETEAKQKGRQYPACPIMIYDIPMYDSAELQDFIHNRVGIHERAMMLLDDELPPCTEEETWAKPTMYAVMEAGKKRAKKLFSTINEADEFAFNHRLHAFLYVQERPGERTRCERFCECREFCSQWKEFNETKNG